MPWTLWLRRTVCTNCGARIPVPNEGEWMTCAHCDAQQPVPDLTRRLQRPLERPPTARPRPTEAPVPTAVRWAAIACALALAAGAAWLLIGPPTALDDGLEAFATAARRARQLGYRAAGKPLTTDEPQTQRELRLPLDARRCYALVVGASETIEHIGLQRADLQQGWIAQSRPARAFHLLLHCPPRSARHFARVTLARPGRLTYKLFERRRRRDDEPAPAAGHPAADDVVEYGAAADAAL